MAAALGMTHSALKRTELGKIPVSDELLERLQVMGVSPASFEPDERGYYRYEVPLDFKNEPLQKRQALPVGAIGLDLLRCQVEATVDHYFAYAPDEGAQLTILFAMQQAVTNLPKIYQPGGEPPRNYLELHRAAIILGQIQLMKFMLDRGKAFVVAGGNLRNIERNKGGWEGREAAAAERIASLTLELAATEQLWGAEANLLLVHAMVYDSVKFLVSGKLPEPETEDEKGMLQDLLKFLQEFLLWLRLQAPLVEMDRRIHPGWVAFHLLQHIGIISASPRQAGSGTN